MTNQASEDELKKRIGNLHAYNFDGDDVTVKVMVDEDVLESIAEFVEAIIHTEKLKLLDKIVGIASNKQFKDYTKQDIASFFSRLGELERELEAEL